MECYGNYALVLKKEWGARIGVSPICYVHPNSVGMTYDYIKSHLLYRQLREIPSSPDNEIATLAMNYLMMSSLIDSGDYDYETLDDFNKADPAALDKMELWESEFKRYFAELKKHNLNVYFTKFMFSFALRLNELHHELESRDSFLRAYEGEFVCPASGKKSNKISYDEKEWRAIKYIDTTDLAKVPHLRDEARSNRYLPESFNLKFSDDDVVAIIVGNSLEKNEVLDLIKGGGSLLSSGWQSDTIYLKNGFKE
ncbi:hypothetical protein HUU05_01765 [candidate division KSB1 bacterium]|nr:hypothetical protein [candidate division KSB1 bacterium]